MGKEGIMAAVPDKIMTWQMVQPTAKDKETGEIIPGKLEKKKIPPLVSLRSWNRKERL